LTADPRLAGDTRPQSTINAIRPAEANSCMAASSAREYGAALFRSPSSSRSSP
jgi:hypothetical protein